MCALPSHTFAYELVTAQNQGLCPSLWGLTRSHRASPKTTHQVDRDRWRKQQFPLGINIHALLRLHDQCTTTTHPEPHQCTYLRENEAVLVCEGDAALLGHVVEQPRSVLQAGEVQLPDGLLAFHEGEFVEIFVRGHAVFDGLQVLPGALEVQLLEVAPLSGSEVELRVAVLVHQGHLLIDRGVWIPALLFCCFGVSLES